MEIRLTTKDADFILTYLRSDLERLNDNCDKVHANEKRLEKLRFKVCKDGNEAEKTFVEITAKALEKDIAEYNRLYQEHTDKIVKCIELLTIGSADE